MDKKTYSQTCPVHGTVLITDRIQSVKSREDGNIYEKPIFYCSKCTCYYIFIDELKSSYRAEARTKSGITIKIQGKHKRHALNDPIASKNPDKINAVIHSQALKPKIKRSINDGLLTAEIIEESRKMPKLCPKCNNRLSDLEYNVSSKSKKRKSLYGRACLSCGTNYFHYCVYKSHESCFTKEIAKEIPNLNNKEEVNDMDNASYIQKEEQSDKGIGITAKDVLPTSRPNADDQNNMSNQIIESNQTTGNISDSSAETITDDFGIEFDLSTLSYVLEL